MDFLSALGPWGMTVSAAMALLFAFGIWRYLLPLWRTSRAFKRAAERVKANRGQRVLFPTRPRHLNDLWSQYLADREGTTVPVGDVEISTVDPEDIFTEHAVLEGYNRNMALALAGVFTGLGILGTFLGLVVGLGSIGGTGQDALLGSIVGLLGGMSTAFYTSIFGIALSLVWLFLDRALYHEVQRRVGRFFLAVRKAYPVESADRLLHRLLKVEQEESDAIHRTNDILGLTNAVLGEQRKIQETSGATLLHSARVQEEQKAILQNLGVDLAAAFENALASSLDERVAPLLQGVIASVEALSTKMGERQVEAMERLVDSFQDRLSDQLGGHFEHLSGALKDAAEWQERVHGDMETLLETVRRATEGQREVIERSAETCDLFHRSLGDLRESHLQIARSAEIVEGTASRITGELEAFGGRLTSHLEQVSSSLSRNLERSAAMVDGMAEALTASVERVDLQARALEGRIEQLDAQQETYRHANEEIRTALAAQIDQIGEQLGTLRSFWGEFRGDLAHVGDHLRESVSSFSVFTAEKLSEIFARFDAEMATVVEHLSGTLAEMREVTEDLPAGVERLRDSLDGAVKPIAEASQRIGELPESLRSVGELTAAMRALTPLGEQIRAAAQQVGGTDRAILRLGEQLESTGQRFEIAIARFGQVPGAPRSASGSTPAAPATPAP